MNQVIEKKKLEHVWSILCESAVIDIETNNVSINNIIEELTVSQNKEDIGKHDIGKGAIVPMRFEIVSLWKKNDEKDGAISAQEEFELIDPNGVSLGKGVNEFDIPKGKKRMRIRIKINALKITTPGEYTFKIKGKEKDDKNFMEEGKISFIVNFATSKK